jgi:cytoskeleton protein RodZ
MFELGTSLREARVRQGLDYPQVELATKIRSRYLRALEDEQFDALPAETYVKGFLRTYADYLGLDGQLYVDEFSSRFGGIDLDEERAPRRVSPRARRERGLERKVVLLGLAGIVALAALVIVAWRFGGSSPSTPSVLPPQSPAESQLQLTGVGKGSYVEVRGRSATGPMLLQETVPGGVVARVNGSRFWLYVRRAGGVRVQLGGRPVALPARRNLRVLVTPSSTALAGG